MNPAKIAEKVWFGYGKAGQKIGFDCDVYRDYGADAPLAGVYFIGTKRAAFSPNNSFTAPNRYGNASWRVFVDANFTQKFDYLIGDLSWFIAEQMPDLPPMAVQCNRVISIKRPAQSTATGLNSYGGNTKDTETPVMTGFPASMLAASRAESLVRLPGDSRDPWWNVLLPPVPGVTIFSRDVITDDQGWRFVIASAELTELGWRLVAGQAQA